MTREFLKGLGLEDATIDKILDENMSDIGKEKRRTEAAEAKTATANADLKATRETLSATQSELETLKASNGDIAKVQQQMAELQAKYDADTAELKGQLADRDYSDAISRSISGKGLKFSSKSARAAFIAALKEKRLELRDGELSGLDDFIKAQKEADPDAFAPDTPAPRFSTPGGGGHGNPGGNGHQTQAEMMAQAIGKASAESGKTANNIISSYLGGNANGT